jgi:protein arginine N-methyltransferase 1
MSMSSRLQPYRHIHAHGELLSDRVRTESYRRAILATVKSGDIVLDLGCGIGLLTLFACQAGAQRVYAVEVTEMVEVARLICRENGFEDRVVFVNGHSREVDLPEPVDVIITETMGSFGVGEGMLASVSDAGQRFLNPGGVIVPAALDLIVAPVESEALYRACDPWSENPYQLDLNSARPFALNNPFRVELTGDHLLSDPAVLTRIVLAQVEEADVNAQVSCLANRKGVLHGIGGWFAANLAPGIRLSNAPPLRTPNWRHAFFPVEHPVQLKAADEVRVTIRVSGGDRHFSWRVEVFRGQGPAGDIPSQVACLDQGASRAFPLSDYWLRRFLHSESMLFDAD